MIWRRKNVPAKVTRQLEGAKARKLSGRVLTAEAMDARNTFELPDTVKTAEFDAVQLAGEGFTATLPAKSVVVLEVE